MTVIPHKIILSAEDDEDDRELLLHILSKLDRSIKVILTHNGQELVHELESMTKDGVIPSLIILDLNMPVKDGWETLELIKNDGEWNTIPVAVFTSSNAQHQNKQLSLKYNVDVISKPVTYVEMVYEIERMASFCKE